MSEALEVIGVDGKGILVAGLCLMKLILLLMQQTLLYGQQGGGLLLRITGA